MKNAPCLIAIAILAAGPASARDDHNMYPIEDALNSPSAKGKLDPGVKLFFGKQQHPGVAKTIGERGTNKKTNAFNKSDKQACEWTFLSAVLALQEQARKQGGDAVIDIRSNYKSIERSSETQYMCGNGNIMAGVAFKGTVVKLVGD